MTNRKNIPNEEHPNFILWRYRLVVATVVIIFACLVARTAYIQVINPEHLRKQADMRSLRVASQQVQRGIITDRNGVELAVSVPVMAIHVDPRTIKNKNSFDKKRAWQAFAEILDLDLVDSHHREHHDATGNQADEYCGVGCHHVGAGGDADESREHPVQRHGEVRLPEGDPRGEHGD